MSQCHCSSLSVLSNSSLYSQADFRLTNSGLPSVRWTINSARLAVASSVESRMVSHHFVAIGIGQRPQANFDKRALVFLNIAEQFVEWMDAVDFVVAIRTYEKQKGMFMMIGEQVLQKIEGGAVAPLQIVDKQHQRIIFVGQTGQKAAEQIIEAVAGFYWRQMPTSG